MAMSNDYRPVGIPEGSIISTDTQHETLQTHIKSCVQCQEAIAHTGKDMTSDYSSRSAEFGKRTRMCDEYLKIVMWFASQ